jgi:acetyltransferase-like isoleucine patch superfamily enzyme
VTIGERCVVGANSVVTRDLPDGVIAAGSPARVIREIDFSGSGRLGPEVAG